MSSQKLLELGLRRETFCGVCDEGGDEGFRSISPLSPGVETRRFEKDGTKNNQRVLT
jgi:hypothetical protein